MYKTLLILMIHAFHDCSLYITIYKCNLFSKNMCIKFAKKYVAIGGKTILRFNLSFLISWGACPQTS